MARISKPQRLVATNLDDAGARHINIIVIATKEAPVPAFEKAHVLRVELGARLIRRHLCAGRSHLDTLGPQVPDSGLVVLEDELNETPVGVPPLQLGSQLRGVRALLDIEHQLIAAASHGQGAGPSRCRPLTNAAGLGIQRRGSQEPAAQQQRRQQAHRVEQCPGCAGLKSD